MPEQRDISRSGTGGDTVKKARIMLDALVDAPVDRREKVEQAGEVARAYAESRKRPNAASSEPAAAPQSDTVTPQSDTAAASSEPAATPQPPSLDQLESELERVEYRSRFRRVLGSTVGALVVVAALAILVATLWMPVLRIYGTSMTPTLEDGDIVVTVKDGSFSQGDIIAFYYNNKVLVKRVIAGSGDWVNITDDGTVYVNNTRLDEPYLTERDKGECNISLPYQVPEGKLFVMGDHRSTSVDSRSTSVGCVSEEQIVGKLVFSAWPLGTFGPVG